MSTSTSCSAAYQNKKAIKPKRFGATIRCSSLTRLTPVSQPGEVVYYRRPADNETETRRCHSRSFSAHSICRADCGHFVLLSVDLDSVHLHSFPSIHSFHLARDISKTPFLVV